MGRIVRDFKLLTIPYYIFGNCKNRPVIRILFRPFYLLLLLLFLQYLFIYFYYSIYLFIYNYYFLLQRTFIGIEPW